MPDKQAKKEQKNPFLPTLSINKWQPDSEMMQSLDQSMLRVRGGMGQEPDQWHKDYRHG